MLKMKSECERCNAALNARSDAYICSYECTFCVKCADEMQHVCPNCDGELVRRPKRDRDPVPVAAGLFKRKLLGLFGGSGST